MQPIDQNSTPLDEGRAMATSPTTYTFLWRKLASKHWYPKAVSAPTLEVAMERAATLLKLHDPLLRELVVDHSVKVTHPGGDVGRDSLRDLKTPFPIEWRNAVHTQTPVAQDA